MKTLTKQIENYISAGYLAFYLHSVETARVDHLVQQVAEKLKFKVIELNAAYGRVDFATKQFPDNAQIETRLEVLLDKLRNEDLEQTLILIKNAKLGLENNPLATSRLLFLLEQLQRHYKGECAVILQSAEVYLPADIEPMVTLIDLPLPKTAEIRPLVKAQFTDVEEGLENRLATALSGLNELELQQLLSLLKNRFNTLSEENSSAIFDEIQRQKEQIIAKSGVLEMVKVGNQLSDIGGLENLKTWLKEQSQILKRLEEAKKFGVKAPKGTLIAGMPGCGKSLAAKAAAQLFQQPLLRLDIGSLLGKYVGESETNMRKALAMAESISPCVLWVDELEKAFVGMSGNNASEVSSRLLGYFLTWLQEKTAPVFIIATANDITALPPELLRKGRFDEIFYVAFPNKTERKKILEIHLSKAQQPLNQLNLNELAIQCRDYAGADIENAVSEAVKKTFLHNEEQVSQQRLAESIEKTIPLRKTLKDKVGEYEKKFDELFLTPASNEDGLSIAQMIKMSENPNYLERKKVAEYEEVTEDILEKLVQDENLDVRRAAFKNPNCPTHLLDKQLVLKPEHKGYDKEILTIISKHRNVSFELALKEFSPDSKEIIHLINQPKNQIYISKIEKTNILENIAENANLSLKSQIILAGKANVGVLKCLVKNKSLRNEVLPRLAKNLLFKPELLVILLENKGIEIDLSIKQLIRTELLKIANNSENWEPTDLVKNLLKREDLGITIQMILARFKSSKVKLELIKLKNLEKEVRQILAQDPNPDVRNALMKRYRESYYSS